MAWSARDELLLVPLEFHASQGLKVGLYTPTILRNYYLNWLYNRGAIKDPTLTGTSKGLSEAINRGPIRKFLPKYANVYVTIQSHGLSASARTHYVTDTGVRNRLWSPGPVTTSCSPPGTAVSSIQMAVWIG